MTDGVMGCVCCGFILSCTVFLGHTSPTISSPLITWSSLCGQYEPLLCLGSPLLHNLPLALHNLPLSSRGTWWASREVKLLTDSALHLKLIGLLKYFLLSLKKLFCAKLAVNYWGANTRKKGVCCSCIFYIILMQRS